MWSIVVGVCAFFSASMVGIWLKRRQTEKCAFYKDFYDYLSFSEEKIAYERMPLADIKRLFHGESAAFRELLDGREVSLALPVEEILSVREYLDTIGTTDADTQLASLRSKCSELKKKLDGDVAKWKKESVLYFKLCVLAGVALFVILA